MMLVRWPLGSKRVRKAREADAFEKAAIHEAKKQAVDGIIYGHNSHHPAVKVVDGILYCNDGDWIENCTALVENGSGHYRVIALGVLKLKK